MLGQFTRLSHNVEITDAEVREAIEAVAPEAWLREQRNKIIDNVSAYISSERASLALTIELEERARAAATGLTGLAENKLVEVVDAIPACGSLQEGLQAAQELEGGALPSCKPAQVTGTLIANTLAAPFQDDIERLIVNQIPPSFTFTEQNLEDLIGQDAIQRINDVRRWVSDGFTYTQADLRRDIAEGDMEFTVNDLEVLRDNLDNDRTFTQVDFTDRLLGDRPERRRDFEDIRDRVGQARDLWAVVFIVPAIILLLIAFLGGRNWHSRLKWAAFTVFISSLAYWIAASPVYDAFSEDTINDIISSATEDLDRQVTVDVVTEIINRGVGVAERWKDGFADRALYFAIGSGAVFVLSALWSISRRRRPRSQP